MISLKKNGEIIATIPKTQIVAAAAIREIDGFGRRNADG
jgi:hypothetical protein